MKRKYYYYRALGSRAHWISRIRPASSSGYCKYHLRIVWLSK